jgi:type I restriction enzyme R subunit
VKDNVSKLTQAYHLAMPDDEIFKYKEEVAFFQSLRAYIVKLTENQRKPSAMVDEVLRQVLSSAIVSQEPTDVLELLGYEKADISILSEEFLSRIRTMPEKNLAAELLKRILREHVSQMLRENLVQSKKFSELLQESITKYEKRIIDTTEFINILIEFAKEIKEAGKRGEMLNLTNEELAFYDALGTDNVAVKLMGDGILRSIAMDVAKRVNENMTVDWSIR